MLRKLIINADDYGYSPHYDEGILEAAAAGAIDAASVMVARPGVEPAPLLATGIGIGLHLELPRGSGSAPVRASAVERDAAEAALADQYARFRQLFGRAPDHLDSHHHTHARPGLGVVVADFAAARGLPVRSVNRRQRRTLRCRGVPTPDGLIGRLGESEPALPEELSRPGSLPAVTEWMVHPGRRDPVRASSFDRGREEDLALLLGWQPPDGIERCRQADLLAC